MGSKTAASAPVARGRDSMLQSPIPAAFNKDSSMADLVLTAANVVAGSSATKVSGINAGATVTAGQVVYLRQRTPTPISWPTTTAPPPPPARPLASRFTLRSAVSRSTLLTSGPITIGATTRCGEVYTAFPRLRVPSPALPTWATGDYNTIVGIATSTTVLRRQVPRVWRRCPLMDAGKFDRRITLQRKTEADDGYATSASTWSTLPPSGRKSCPRLRLSVAAATGNRRILEDQLPHRKDALCGPTSTRRIARLNTPHETSVQRS
jgi:hypothetical protein